MSSKLLLSSGVVEQNSLETSASSPLATRSPVLANTLSATTKKDLGDKPVL
jgi:hypothetical protein